jgi:cytochrome c biogenesis protein CcmG, thiol:disulfide interchange protein DsbE
MSDSGGARRQWWFVGGVVGLLVLLVGLAWSVRDRFLPVEVGTRAPNFAASDLSGRPVKLDDLRGEVVLLNIWATWCAPCREEMPSLERLHRALSGEGLRIIAVSVDAESGSLDRDGRAGGDVAAFGREFGLTFTLWHDPSGGVQQVYRTTGVPETFVIGRDGVIRKKVIGAMAWDDPSQMELIRRLLRE